MRSGHGPLAEPERVQVEPLDLLKSRQQDVEIVVDRQVTSGQRVGLAGSESHDVLRCVPWLGEPPSGSLLLGPLLNLGDGRTCWSRPRVQTGGGEADRQEAGMEAEHSDPVASDL